MSATQEHSSMRKKIFEGTKKELNSYLKKRPISDTKRFTIYEDDNSIDDEPPLTPEQIESIERGVKDAQEGRYISDEEHTERFNKKVKGFIAQKNAV